MERKKPHTYDGPGSEPISSKEVDKKIEDLPLKVSILENLGVFYKNQCEHDKTLKYYEVALEIYGKFEHIESADVSKKEIEFLT